MQCRDFLPLLGGVLIGIAFYWVWLLLMYNKWSFRRRQIKAAYEWNEPDWADVVPTDIEPWLGRLPKPLRHYFVWEMGEKP